MNSIRSIFGTIVSEDNILDAINDEYTGCTGRRKNRVADMMDEDRIGYVVKEIQDRLWSDELQLGLPVIFDKVENCKLRHIVAPNVDDAILIRAIVRVAEPLVYAKMTRHSYCPVPGRGGLLLARDLQRKLRKAHYANEQWKGNHPKSKPRKVYALKLDIRKFFPSVKHEVAMAALRRVFGSRGDRKVLSILDRLIGEHLEIGAGYSAMAANAVLMPIDEEMECYVGVLGYFRYMDDIVMLFRSKAKAREAREHAERLLNALGLTMARKWQIFDTEMRPIVMGGFKIRRTGIHPSGHVCRGLNRQLAKGIRIGFENLTVHECRSLASRYGWIKNTDSFTYKNKWRKANADIVFRRCGVSDGNAGHGGKASS